ncbi:MAG: hypothetical protein A3G40_04785 [Deltaproteobacteria bacterium RIFCSPLOWO2_12_FULL_57_22]|nr:MAG: hypothetical protein A3G40_04785 [Deltaproteobacteria bacterium RIFCSPLOWO2_12_FULL_57_22]
MTDFEFPTSLEEACQSLSQSAGEARLIAGGVALMVLVRHQIFFPTRLISLKRIPGLDRIAFDEKEGLGIGALVTHAQVESSPIVRQHYPALAQCVHHVGNLRVRNMGTLVGDLCQADNHSDPAPLLGVLGAKVRARSLRGERLLSMAEFHVDIYETGVKEDEIVTEIVIPPSAPQARTAYLRFSGNSPVDWPILGVAGSLICEDGRCAEVKISVGSLAAVPMSFEAECEALKGKKITAAAIKKFARACTATMEPIPDARGSEWYKKQVAEVYIRRTLETLMK